VIVYLVSDCLLVCYKVGRERDKEGIVCEMGEKVIAYAVGVTHDLLFSCGQVCQSQTVHHHTHASTHAHTPSRWILFLTRARTTQTGPPYTLSAMAGACAMAVAYAAVFCDGTGAPVPQARV